MFEVADDVNEPGDEVVTALIGLGSNLGDRRGNLSRGLTSLREMKGLRLVCASSLYETRPEEVVGEHGDFLNACALLETRLSADELLEALLATELEFGRDRAMPLAPRPLDLDLLLYGDLVLETPRLTLPHPRMHRRGFVLVPAAEIAGSLLHPRLKKPVEVLLAELGEVQGVVRRRKAGTWIR